MKTKDKFNLTQSVLPSGIAYAGNVTVKKISGNKVVYSRTYHNNGTARLFKYLAGALIGSFDKSGIPARLRLYGITATALEGTLSNPDSFDPQTIFSATGSDSVLLRATAPLIYETTPRIDIKNPGNLSSPVLITYSFKIPYSMISEDAVYLAGLFPNKQVDNDYDELLAYYLFENSEGAWEPITKEFDNMNTYTLLLEWTMSINNTASY